MQHHPNILSKHHCFDLLPLPANETRPNTSSPSPSHLDQRFCRDPSVYFRHHNPGGCPDRRVHPGGQVLQVKTENPDRIDAPGSRPPCTLALLPSPEMKNRTSGGWEVGEQSMVRGGRWKATRRSPTVRPFPPPSLPSLPSPVPTPRARPPPPSVDPSHYRSTARSAAPGAHGAAGACETR